jgi:hypothetical protein
MSLQSFIQNIPSDKKDHLILGTVVSFPLILLGYFLGNFIFSPLEVANYFGFFSILLYGLKEIIHDGIQKKGKVEFLDFFYNSIPAIQLLIILNL